jgi:3-keto-disaccharide hydrolase
MPVSANPIAENSFLIWRGGTVRDFELKIEFRINGTNSGVQYRSKEMPEVGKWVLSGYQADMDFANQFTGNVHNERGPRFFLSQRGNIVRGVDGGGRKQVGTIETPDALKADIKVNDWNQYHIVVGGWTFMHFINGHLMAVFIDEDTTNRMAEGRLGLQMHVGDPFKVEYRNVWLKKLVN